MLVHILELVGTLERRPGAVPIVVAEDLSTPPQRLDHLPLRHYGSGPIETSKPAFFPLSSGDFAPDQFPERSVGKL
jgi:hypothetical protein